MQQGACAVCRAVVEQALCQGFDFCAAVWVGLQLAKALVVESVAGLKLVQNVQYCVQVDADVGLCNGGVAGCGGNVVPPSGSYSVRNNRRAGTKRLPRYGLTGSVGDGGLAVCAEEAAAISRGNG